MSTPAAHAFTTFRDVLRIRDYRLLWAAQVVSTFGDRLTQIAITAVVFALTGSEVSIGLALSLTMLPQAAFGLPAGAIADRCSRKTLLVTTDIVRAGLILTLALLARLPVEMVYVVAALHATATVFFAPARYAVLPDIVAPDQLLQANSLDETSQSALDPIAYVVGGALVAVVGTRLSFSLDALTFAASATLIAATTTRRAAMWRAPRDDARSDFWHEMLAGLRHIWGTPRLRANTILMLLASLAASAESPLTYMLVLGHWRTGAWGLGVIEAGLAVGIVAGSLICSYVVEILGRGLCILLGLVLTSISMIVVAQLSFWPAVLLIAISGVFNMLFWVPTVNLQLELAPPAARARVLSARRSLSTLTIFISYALSTVLVSGMAATTVLTLFGVALFGVSVGGLNYSELRRP
jgi:MFS family permease